MWPPDPEDQEFVLGGPFNDFGVRWSLVDRWFREKSKPENDGDIDGAAYASSMKSLFDDFKLPGTNSSEWAIFQNTSGFDVLWRVYVTAYTEHGPKVCRALLECQREQSGRSDGSQFALKLAGYDGCKRYRDSMVIYCKDEGARDTVLRVVKEYAQANPDHLCHETVRFTCRVATAPGVGYAMDPPFPYGDEAWVAAVRTWQSENTNVSKDAFDKDDITFSYSSLLVTAITQCWFDGGQWSLERVRAAFAALGVDLGTGQVGLNRRAANGLSEQQRKRAVYWLRCKVFPGLTFRPGVPYPVE